MLIVRATENGYFNNQKRKEGEAFAIRERIANNGKTITIDQQFSSKWMEKVDQPNKTKAPANTNWEQKEADRLAVADATAAAEIEVMNEARLQSEAEEAAAVEAAISGTGQAQAEPDQEESITSGTPNEEEEVI